MAVTVKRDGPVTLVSLSRLDVRNAVDGETAHALADAFRDFDADDDAAVAVFFGEHGTFCAGADAMPVTSAYDIIRFTKPIELQLLRIL